MTVALMGALLLLFGSVKVFLWINERLVARQVAYEQGDPPTGVGGRVQAGRTAAMVWWREPSQPLRILDPISSLTTSDQQ
ncbi:MAG: hypothetical protein HYY59_02090 [Candidatus Omnitrophica bacterium]|nr:hypothetical protein [Candidatus Omnitrophota bacterium]MBI3020774.1 hypothetical protein [Candidatus Omnitrophota bacterium]